MVDDTEENRYVAAKWLERAGFQVALATTGADALRLATSEIELVVLDVHLPDLHGFEVTRKLKSDPSTAYLPVLHLSAKHVTVHDRVHGLAAGADAYLIQPVVPEELIATVGALLRLSRVERDLRHRNAELEAASAAALRARDRTEQVLALSVALTTALTPDEVAAAVIRHVSTMFGAADTVIARVDDDDYKDSQSPLAQVIRTGEPLFLETSAVAPLVVNDVVIGSLGVAFTEPRSFIDEDRALLRSTAQHSALALERARLVEAERASRREAELANRSKSEFLAVMSHELRTPLNAIGGYAELMEMGLHGPVTAEQTSALARIQRSQRHLLGLINGVLNYARVEGGHVHYDIADVVMDEVLATCEALIAPQARAKNVALRFDGCAASLRARGDGDKVQQIILNLLSNGVKFTEPGGRLEMSCGPSAGGSAHVEVRVSDTGPGIEPEQLERVFQPFVQLDARLTRTREGTGLGLAISRDLARGMGGDLTLASTPGVGSTFTLTLPAE